MVYDFKHINESLPDLSSGLWWDAFTEWHETGAADSGWWYLRASTYAVSGGDVCEEIHFLAFSECEEELLLFAEVNGIPLKASCQQS